MAQRTAQNIFRPSSSVNLRKNLIWHYFFQAISSLPTKLLYPVLINMTTIIDGIWWTVETMKNFTMYFSSSLCYSSLRSNYSSQQTVPIHIHHLIVFWKSRLKSQTRVTYHWLRIFVVFLYFYRKNLREVTTTTSLFVFPNPSFIVILSLKAMWYIQMIVNL